MNIYDSIMWLKSNKWWLSIKFPLTNNSALSGSRVDWVARQTLRPVPNPDKGGGLGGKVSSLPTVKERTTLTDFAIASASDTGRTLQTDDTARKRKKRLWRKNIIRLVGISCPRTIRITRSSWKWKSIKHWTFARSLKRRRKARVMQDIKTISFSIAELIRTSEYRQE